MRTVKILGTGCASCKRTEAMVEAVVSQLNLDFKIEKIEDIQEIMSYDVMSTPAIVIDEEVVVKGRVPSLTELKDLLTAESCCSNSGGSCCGGGNHEHGENCSSESHSKEGSCCSTSDSDCC